METQLQEAGLSFKWNVQHAWRLEFTGNQRTSRMEHRRRCTKRLYSAVVLIRFESLKLKTFLKCGRSGRYVFILKQGITYIAHVEKYVFQRWWVVSKYEPDTTTRNLLSPFTSSKRNHCEATVNSESKMAAWRFSPMRMKGCILLILSVGIPRLLLSSAECLPPEGKKKPLTVLTGIKNRSAFRNEASRKD